MAAQNVVAAAAFVLSIPWVLLLLVGSARADCTPTVLSCPLITPASEFFPSVTSKSSSPITADVSAALESAIASFIAENSVSQYAIAIIHEDQTVFTSGLATTPFLIGSITKTFTALGALILREKGLLSLDDPVKKFLPSFSIINPYEPHDTTLRELMGHVSGMPRELCANSIVSGQSEEQCPVEESDVLKSVSKMELARPPWSREPAYSNLGFALLGHTWEKATSPSKSWQQFVTEDIVKPLGLNDTGVDLTNVTLAGNITDDATELDIGWVGPAGQMYSTATDLAKYLIFLLKASPPLISATSIREWTRPSTIFPDNQGGFALPWELLLVNSSSEFLITKGGAFGGAIGTYLSFIAIHPPTQLGISVLFGYNASASPLLGPDSLGSQLLSSLIPLVEAANQETIDTLYNGLYICKPTPQIFSQPLNATAQVLGGYLNVTGSPSLGLSVFVNASLVVDGDPDLVVAPLAMLLKNATENSFWVGSYGSSCFSFFAGISSEPSTNAPNYPGTSYANEIVFALKNKTVEWPAVGAVCVKQ